LVFKGNRRALPGSNAPIICTSPCFAAVKPSKRLQNWMPPFCPAVRYRLNDRYIVVSYFCFTEQFFHLSRSSINPSKVLWSSLQYLWRLFCFVFSLVTIFVSKRDACCHGTCHHLKECVTSTGHRSAAWGETPPATFLSFYRRRGRGKQGWNPTLVRRGGGWGGGRGDEGVRERRHATHATHRRKRRVESGVTSATVNTPTSAGGVGVWGDCSHVLLIKGRGYEATVEMRSH